MAPASWLAGVSTTRPCPTRPPASGTLIASALPPVAVAPAALEGAEEGEEEGRVPWSAERGGVLGARTSPGETIAWKFTLQERAGGGEMEVQLQL